MILSNSLLTTAGIEQQMHSFSSKLYDRTKIKERGYHFEASKCEQTMLGRREHKGT